MFLIRANTFCQEHLVDARPRFLCFCLYLSVSLSLHLGCVDDALSCRERAHTGPDAGASRNYVTSLQADWL